ncbi:hypothetical protein [Streptomyces sp. NPDC048639]|uniref:hypothetical protein n=1 Tax=Streptomyces sp. NPDC048639 TaxID=3365581 RepID=UPI00371D9FB6
MNAGPEHNTRTPADFRLHPAIPRILAPPRQQRAADGQELEIAITVSDPDRTYG